MNKYLLIISIAAWILISISPILVSGAQKAEAGFNLGKALVITQGNSLLPIADPSGPEPKVVQKFIMIITGYSSTEDQTDSDPLITAAGTLVKDGIIASNMLPFGTKIKIPDLYGDKVFVVEDRMSWKKGNYHIDIWFPTRELALEFGAKSAEALILSD